MMSNIGDVLSRWTSATATSRDDLIGAIDRVMEKKDRETVVQAILAGPAGLMVGDSAAELGEMELALELYRHAVRDSEYDNEALAQIGRFLLARAGAPLTPFSPEDQAEDVEFEIYEDVPFTIKVAPAFPQSYELPLYELSAEAFARALLRLQDIWAVGELLDTDPEEWPTWADSVHALLSLDGLRCGLLLSGSYDDVDPVVTLMLSSCSDWEVEGGPYEFSEPFRVRAAETKGWLRGRSGEPLWRTSKLPDEDISEEAHPGREPDLTSELRLLRFQGREMLDLLRTLPTSLSDSIRTDLLRTPEESLADAERKLYEEMGSIWESLGGDVRRMLQQAEILRPVLSERRGIDWAPVILHYSRALELHLHRQLRKDLIAGLVNQSRTDARPREAARLQEQATTWSIGDYGSQLAKVADKSANPRAARDFSRRLRDFAREYRNPAVHAGEFIDPERARHARDLVIAQNGLLAELGRLRL